MKQKSYGLCKIKIKPWIQKLHRPWIPEGPNRKKANTLCYLLICHKKIRYWPSNAQSNMDPDFKTGFFNKSQYQIHAKPGPNKKKIPNRFPDTSKIPHT